MFSSCRIFFSITISAFFIHCPLFTMENKKNTEMVEFIHNGFQFNPIGYISTQVLSWVEQAAGKNINNKQKNAKKRTVSKSYLADCVQTVIQNGGTIKPWILPGNTQLITKDGDWQHIDGPIYEAYKNKYINQTAQQSINTQNK
ncbi:hypothetical protein KC460_04415 [Candidatus Dependentiae bacterium]|nr:hypothetical protein [Candidatus Dependentiae bacterium]